LPGGWEEGIAEPLHAGRKVADVQREREEKKDGIGSSKRNYKKEKGVPCRSNYLEKGHLTLQAGKKKE